MRFIDRFEIFNWSIDKIQNGTFKVILYIKAYRRFRDQIRQLWEYQSKYKNQKRVERILDWSNNSNRSGLVTIKWKDWRY